MRTALWRPADAPRAEPAALTAEECAALARLRAVWPVLEYVTRRQLRDLWIARWEYRHGHERWSEWTT